MTKIVDGFFVAIAIVSNKKQNAARIYNYFYFMHKVAFKE